MMSTTTAIASSASAPFAAFAASAATPDRRPRAAGGALRNVHCHALSMRPKQEDAVAAFAREGMTIAVYEVECIFLVNVLTDCGNLYTYDGSHGGGQVFTHKGRA